MNAADLEGMLIEVVADALAESKERVVIKAIREVQQVAPHDGFLLKVGKDKFSVVINKI